jgi:hypothetical protein
LPPALSLPGAVWVSENFLNDDIEVPFRLGGSYLSLDEYMEI